MPTKNEFMYIAGERWEARQKFLKSGVAIHGHGRYTKTACGLSVYNWEEDDWEYSPLADTPEEVTCKKCLQASLP